MTQSIYNRYNTLRDEAKELIINYIKEHECGDIHNLQEEYYELPRTFYIDKYGYYNEYAILGVRIESNYLIFDGFGISDGNYRHNMDFREHEIDLHVMLQVIDELYKIPQNPKLINQQTN